MITKRKTTWFEQKGMPYNPDRKKICRHRYVPYMRYDFDGKKPKKVLFCPKCGKEKHDKKA